MILILKATRSKTKKLPFSLAAMKFCSSVLSATPAVPTQSSFQAANQHIFGWKNPFASPPKDCPLLHVDFLSRYYETTAFRANSDTMRSGNFQNPFEAV